ncbi:hypothetical protein [Nocardia nova]|uniref:hypothetical protein n=1 Tax=Nocardia nova TaxID=37330 RepID=UPI0015E45902|nr:hypothetical protein [Nocardia nova]
MAEHRIGQPTEHHHHQPRHQRQPGTGAANPEAADQSGDHPEPRSVGPNSRICMPHGTAAGHNAGMLDLYYGLFLLLVEGERLSHIFGV